MNPQQSLLYRTLQLADNALIIGHRLSEWCGHGPILEQDIALTNISLDHIGQARSFYQYAAAQYNALSPEEQKNVFASPMFQQVFGAVDEDDLAYLRDVWDFKNTLLVEQPNNDWAFTVARSFFYDAFQYLYYQQLRQGSDAELSAIAEKSLKEVTYHRKWSSEWVVRLGDGTEESRIRMQNAIDQLWSFTGELFTPIAEVDENAPINILALKEPWTTYITSVLNEATLEMPSGKWMQQGGKEGRHSEHLGYILTELQFMQRAYPNMEW